MIGSLYTGITGLQAQQQMIDNTANNVANVNTVGFKSTSVEFQNALSRSVSGSGSGAAVGQIGLGVRVSGTPTNFSLGSPKSTGETSNMMIDGNGYFAITKNGATMYTRNGEFSLNSAGNFVTTDGATLQDNTGATIALPALLDGTYASWSISGSGVIKGVATSGATTTLGQIGVATFADPSELQSVGDSDYLPTVGSGAATVSTPGSGGSGQLMSGYVEMSNVDLSQELTDLIVAQRAFQANSKVVTTSDQVLQTLISLKD